VNNHSTVNRTCFRGAAFVVLILPLFFSVLLAKPSDDLPGDEITEEQYFDFITPQDSIKKSTPKTSPESPTWLDQAYKTWDAPSLAVQVAEDKENILMGMGAVYIPYMSDPTIEPDVEIVDSAGAVAASGKAGRKYSLLPGKYYAILGNGAHKQKIVRLVIITENKVTPLIPSWCGLSIDVVDENNQPFRGEYELARIDKFIPFGRGFGRNIDLGENIKTWILKPGVYKIFGSGQGYNTLTNFITVRLLPGEFVRLTLVQNATSTDIIGGGVIQLKGAGELASNWKYRIDVGGGIDFNATYDHAADSATKNETSLSLIFRTYLNYRKNKIGWENRLQLSEEARLPEWNISELSNNVDEIRLRSLFTWHFLPWIGPYGRFETNTQLFPQYDRAPEGEDHYFIVFDENYDNPEFNSTDPSYKLQPSFSPFSIEPGLGANFMTSRTRFFEGKLLTGIGMKYSRIWNESELISRSDIVDSLVEAADIAKMDSIITNDTSYSLIRHINDKDDIKIGPEVILTFLLNLGRWIIVDSEVKFFTPFDRITHPDLNLRSTISWRVLKMITLDYEYVYTLQQSQEEELKQNVSRHRVLIRFSYTSR